MKFSEFWLRKWINLTINTNKSLNYSTDKLIDQITMIGLEVKRIEPVANYFTNVIIGKIIECYPHPKIDKLNIVKVDIGKEKDLYIFCNAPNCRINLLVAVATVNSILSESTKITTNKSLKNILCSFSKLGINNYYDKNIIELPTDAPIGHDIRNYLQLDDNIIDINVTPNRIDCLSLLGISRNIAILNKKKIKQKIFKTITPTINEKLCIHVNEIDACPYYLSRIIKNINIKSKTPLWMKEKLRRCGINLVNTLENITNYVLLEIGQPINILNYDQINGNIIVRYSKKNEILNLPNKDIILLNNTLVISDNYKILALAGIFYNCNFDTNKNNHNIVLECACFRPSSIINNFDYYKINNEKLKYYEFGLDPILQYQAIERTTKLLIDICGGQPSSIISSTYKKTTKKENSIILHRKYLNKIVGHVISNKKIKNILTYLGFKTTNIENDWKVLIPFWRFNIFIEEDLIEEIIRIYGYNKIKNIPIYTNLSVSKFNKNTLLLSRVKTLLIDRGYQEVITYSFVDPKKQSLLYPKKKPLILKYPISKNMSVMRLSLLIGLIDVVIYNQNRQQNRIRLFESGICFIPDKVYNLGVRQEFMLSGIISGPRFKEHWDQTYQPSDFYDIKGDLESIFDLIGNLNHITFKKKKCSFLHPEKSALIYLKEKIIGSIGVIHPKIEKELNLNSNTFIFELLWKKIFRKKIIEIKNISKFPINRRDINIIVADNIASSDIIKECKKIKTNYLIDVNLFDIYNGKNIEKGFKSLSISLLLQSDISTLKENEINKTVTKCINILKEKFQASLRN